MKQRRGIFIYNIMSDKKSFVLYNDLKGVVDKLPTLESGLLFKAILAYVEGSYEPSDNLLVEIAFEPIKAQLDRDNEKWKKTCEARSAAGKKGGRPSKAKASLALPKKAKNLRL